jgi:hypothetical protein
VRLPDWGLLSGNYGKAGDIVVEPDAVRVSEGGQAGQGAVLAFDVEERRATVGEVMHLSLDVDPRGERINGAMVQLDFDPALIEILDVSLGSDLPFVLQAPSIDKEQGSVSLAAGLLGEGRTDRITVATLSIRLKAETSGTAIRPADLLMHTDVSGSGGSILTEAGRITLRTKDPQTPGHILWLPFVSVQ